MTLTCGSIASTRTDDPGCHQAVFALAPQGECTQVTLSQSNLTGGVRPSDREKREDYEENWAMVLDGLEKAVTSES